MPKGPAETVGRVPVTVKELLEHERVAAMICPYCNVPIAEAWHPLYATRDINGLGLTVI